jgi:hypothetical protein
VCRCPTHDDRSPSLSWKEGSDRRALIHCHALCDPDDIVKALGLTWPDLFPDGHSKAGRRSHVPKPPVANGEPTAEVLAALSAIGIVWHRTSAPKMWIADRCPGCGERRPGALWIADGEQWVRRRDARAILTCFSGCSFEEILTAIEHELTAGERVTA